MRPRAWIVAALCAFSAGCSPGNDREATVTLFAAASTIDAVDAIAEAFESTMPGVQVRVNAASTAVLARQLEAGAEADLFLAAHPTWADYVAERGLVAERVDLLNNALVVIVANDSERTGLDAVRTAERVAIADPESVPAGIYAKARLQHDGVWDDVEAKLAPAADVREVLFYVERGECDAGIVYKTDALISENVAIAYTWPSLPGHAIHYPLMLLNSEHENARRAFAFFQGPEARAVFERFGFEVLRP